MLDKRTPRSQNFKNYQLQQQHPQSFSKCDALPQPFFDFALADPLPANIYELLKATILYLDAVQSPICSTVRQALLQFEQYAAISSITLASVVSCSIKYQLESQGSLTSTKLPTAASADIFKLDTSSTLQLPSVSSSSTINDDISSLLDISASQLESQCLLFEQQISLCEQFHSIKKNFLFVRHIIFVLIQNLHVCKQTIFNSVNGSPAHMIKNELPSSTLRLLPSSVALTRANAISPQAPPYVQVGVFSLLTRLVQLLLQTPTLRHVLNGTPSLEIFRLHLSPRTTTVSF
jgi:hypothetical protein